MVTNHDVSDDDDEKRQSLARDVGLRRGFFLNKKKRKSAGVGGRSGELTLPSIVDKVLEFFMT